MCGGSIINEKFVITAAHCTRTVKKSDIKIVFGNSDLNYRMTYGAERSVVQMIPHPNYEDGMSYHDIALLELNQELTFSDYIFPICLPSQPNHNQDHRLHQASTLAGWGQEEDEGRSSDQLRQAQLTIFSSYSCNSSRWETNRYTGVNESSSSLVPKLFQSSILCAGEIASKKL